MNVKKRLTREVILTGVTFVLLVLLVNVFFLQISSSLNSLIDEADPSLRAMEHMLTEVSRGSVFILDYINTDDADSFNMFDMELSDADMRCSAIAANINQLIDSNAISDHYIISDYKSAHALFAQTKGVRDEIIQLRKQEVLEGMNRGERINQLVFKYQLLMHDSIRKFSDGIEKLTTRNEKLHDELALKTKTYIIVMLLLSCAFIVTLFIRMKKISREFIEPIDATCTTTKQFVDGDHNAQIKDISQFKELSELQHSINSVFGVISNVASESEEERAKIETQLLRREYTEILDYLKLQVLNKRQVSITDLKKHLNVTHPTVLTRIKFLEKKGFIVIEKDGREKFLIPTKKATILNE